MRIKIPFSAASRGADWMEKQSGQQAIHGGKDRCQLSPCRGFQLDAHGNRQPTLIEGASGRVNHSDRQLHPILSTFYPAAVNSRAMAIYGRTDVSPREPMGTSWRQRTSEWVDLISYNEL